MLRKPSDARRRKYKVWGELYDKIFSGAAIEPYIICFLIHRLAIRWLEASGYTNSADDISRRLAKNGAFHISRMAAYLWRGDDNWGSKKETGFAKEIETLEEDEAALNDSFESAMEGLLKLIRGNPQYFSDIDSAIKSSNLDSDIDKYLYKGTSKVKRKVKKAKR